MCVPATSLHYAIPMLFLLAQDARRVERTKNGSEMARHRVIVCVVVTPCRSVPRAVPC